MTTPKEREQAQRAADQALENAMKIRTRGVSIAERWRKSQEDNNFRKMLRMIGKGIADAS